MATVQQTLDEMQLEVDAFEAQNLAYRKFKKDTSNVEFKNDYLEKRTRYVAIYDARVKAEQTLTSFKQPYRSPTLPTAEEHAKLCEAERNRYYGNSVCTSNTELLDMYSKVIR